MSDVPPESADSKAHRFVASLRLVSALTLASRVLGLVRDVGMATLFGNGRILDAFTVAFRIPNLARRLFGEGALTAAFLPAFVRELEHENRESAWRLASALLVWLAGGLVALVIVAELVLWGVTLLPGLSDEARLLISLTATLMPYLILICLAAQVAAVMHALNHFAWPAALPIVLNVIWIAAIWIVAPRFESPETQVHVVAAFILVAGLVQFVAPLPTLARLGFRFRHDFKDVGGRLKEIARQMLPVVVGLSVTQFNTLSDSLIAWMFARPESGGEGSIWPLPSGTASALYLGQRLYQFPLGVFGVALGTVLFPLLSRHAQRGQMDSLRKDLELGVRLVLIIGVPASAGLILLAGPLTALLFRYGAFDAADAAQTVAMIAAYGAGVWAYCGLLIVHRAYYAIGDPQTPLRVGLIVVALNLTLNLTLIWPLGGPALAWSTAGCSMLQVLLVGWLLQQRVGRFDLRMLRRTVGRVLVAVFAMVVACTLTLALVGPATSFSGRLLAVGAPFAVAVLVYFVAARLVGLDDLQLLFRRRPSGDEPPGDAP